MANTIKSALLAALGVNLVFVSTRLDGLACAALAVFGVACVAVGCAVGLGLVEVKVEGLDA